MAETTRLLPLAPRLFELLVEGGNNWMAIKLIKLVRPGDMICGKTDSDGPSIV